MFWCPLSTFHMSGKDSSSVISEDEIKREINIYFSKFLFVSSICHIFLLFFARKKWVER